jgi:hydroxyethylthiazole kinase
MKSATKPLPKLLSRIKKEKPLILNITNFVVMNDTANVILHLGALPVMAHAKEEMAEMVGIASALVINIGTLSEPWVESMFLAGKKANKKGIPIILDIVGAGATKYRTDVSNRLINDLKIAAVKGNAGEIGIISGAGGEVKGVESVGKADNLTEKAMEFAKKHQTTVVITGKRDLVTDGKRILAVDNGDAWMGTITGTGCMSTAVVGAFCAVEKDFCLASAAALASFGIAGEKAAKGAKGPASFKVSLLDAVYNLDEKILAKRAKISKLK